MRLLPILSLTLIMCFFSTSQFAADTGPFNSYKLEEAIARAKSEGKLVFLDFSAKWCTPCKWMEETTFKDPIVRQELSEKFVAVKVDIDESEGAAVKEAYDINYLPTMLIINEKGQIVSKVEKTLTAKDLISFLNKHNSSNGVSYYKPNTSPKKVIVEDDENFKISKEAYLAYSKSDDQRDYQLQMGVYSTAEAAFEKVKQLEDRFIEPIVVSKDSRMEEPTYRVLMGNFQTLSEADSFRKILRNDFDLDAIVK